MELDDLKVIWREQPVPTSQEGEHERVMAIIRGSHRSIMRTFTFDILIAISINLVFVAVVLAFDGAVQKFLYKLVIVTNLTSVPIYYRLYKSIQYLAHFDFGLDIRTNLSKFVDYYRKTLALYKWATYGIIVALLVLFAMDESFLGLDLWIKVVVVTYLLLFLASAGWLVQKLYGSRITRMESYLNS